MEEKEKQNGANFHRRRRGKHRPHQGQVQNAQNKGQNQGQNGDIRHVSADKAFSMGEPVGASPARVQVQNAPQNQDQQNQGKKNFHKKNHRNRQRHHNGERASQAQEQVKIEQTLSESVEEEVIAPTNEQAVAPIVEKAHEQAESAEEISTESAPAVSQEPQEKTEIVGVHFKHTARVYYFDPNGLQIRRGAHVIVQTANGNEYGEVSVSNRMIPTADLVLPLRPVLREATEEDEKRHAENADREIEAYNDCVARIANHKLDMKLVDTEMSFDRSKLLFYFIADERVDFRELVKELACAFHTRIEMRQIGIRDEAKMLGGLGICGRPFCCSTFLPDFAQVSIKMAKEQNLSLNSAKISGACGRLMCCLRYEHSTYEQELKITPKVDSLVTTADGDGVVTESNPLTGLLKVRLDGEENTRVYARESVVVNGHQKGASRRTDPRNQKAKEADQSAENTQGDVKNNQNRKKS